MLRVKRIEDGVIFNWTKTLSEKKGFVVFDDTPGTKIGLSNKTEVVESVETNAVESAENDLSKMTRKEIGEHILNKYGVQIPNMNRKTVDILKDAYKIADEQYEQDRHDEAVARLEEDSEEETVT